MKALWKIVKNVLDVTKYYRCLIETNQASLKWFIFGLILSMVSQQTEFKVINYFGYKIQDQQTMMALYDHQNSIIFAINVQNTEKLDPLMKFLDETFQSYNFSAMHWGCRNLAESINLCYSKQGIEGHPNIPQLSHMEPLRESWQQLQTTFSSLKQNNMVDEAHVILPDLFSNISLVFSKSFKFNMMMKSEEYSSFVLGFITQTALEHNVTPGFADQNTIGLNFFHSNTKNTTRLVGTISLKASSCMTLQISSNFEINTPNICFESKMFKASDSTSKNRREHILGTWAKSQIDSQDRSETYFEMMKTLIRIFKTQTSSLNVLKGHLKYIPNILANREFLAEFTHKKHRGLVWKGENDKNHCLVLSINLQQNMGKIITEKENVPAFNDTSDTKIQCDFLEVADTANGLPILNILAPISVDVKNISVIRQRPSRFVDLNFFEFPALAITRILFQFNEFENKKTFETCRDMLVGFLGATNEVVNSKIEPHFYAITNSDGTHRVHMIIENSEKTPRTKVSTFNTTCAKAPLIILSMKNTESGKLGWRLQEDETSLDSKQTFDLNPEKLTGEFPISVGRILSKNINIEIPHSNINTSIKILAMCEQLTKMDYFITFKTFFQVSSLVMDMQTYRKLVNTKFETFAETRLVLEEIILPEHISAFSMSPNSFVIDLFLKNGATNKERAYQYISMNESNENYDKCNDELNLKMIHISQISFSSISSILVTNHDNNWHSRSYWQQTNQPEFQSPSVHENVTKTVGNPLFLALPAEIELSELSTTTRLQYNISELENVEWKYENDRLWCTLTFNNKHLKIQHNSKSKNTKELALVLGDQHQIRFTPYRIWLHTTTDLSSTTPKLQNYLFLAQKFSTYIQLTSATYDQVIFVLGRQIYGTTFKRKPVTVFQAETIVKTEPTMRNKIYNTYGNMTVTIDADCRVFGTNAKFGCKMENVAIVQRRLQNKWNVISLRDLCSKIEQYNHHKLKVVLKRTSKTTACLELYTVNLDSSFRTIVSSIDHFGTIYIENYHLCDDWIVEMESHMRLNMNEDQFGLKPWPYHVSRKVENIVLTPDSSVRPIHVKILRPEEMEDAKYYRIENSLVIEPQMKPHVDEMDSAVVSDRPLILFYQFYDSLFGFPVVFIEFSNRIVKVVKSAPISLI